MFAGKTIHRKVVDALKEVQSNVATYLKDHPEATKQEVAERFGVSLSYVGNVIRNHNAKRRKGRPVKKEK